MDGRIRIEPVLCVAFGAILRGLLSLLTARWFVGLGGGNPVATRGLVLLAVGLEGAKVLRWRRGWRIQGVEGVPDRSSGAGKSGRGPGTSRSIPKPAHPGGGIET